MEDGGWKRESHLLILVGDDVRSLKFSGIQLETRHLVSYGRKITLELSRAAGAGNRTIFGIIFDVRNATDGF
jgi:hypothetical protein